MTKTYFRGMKHPDSKIFKMGTDVLCHTHNKKLEKVDNTATGFGCNACGKLFGDIAKLKARVPGTIARWQCRDCNCDICEYCMQNPVYLQ